MHSSQEDGGTSEEGSIIRTVLTPKPVLAANRLEIVRFKPRTCEPDACHHSRVSNVPKQFDKMMGQVRH
ncbi:hypothetical protein M406DRAFT_62749 [Cryphonectria parasitica EP155]|uniref:Uncharacterized protein n=1 Tax=Cryphonectria parasitica (strain ATCC 38755 / EP155) TaxID=660469 RepID=A0A9P4Y930_CRYP1|nr:uncharacterized protein M406DRAFT_62749 [Cryphonectria parasitica EP155]KAF3768659.1 hypothetical protein M406DRAFT_62749 [Cryphonectria parasitica EP155]